MSHLSVSPASDLDYPPLSDLSLNTFHPSPKCWPPQASMDNARLYGHGHRHNLSQYYGSSQSTNGPLGWSVPAWASTFSSTFQPNPSSWGSFMSGTSGSSSEYDFLPPSPSSTSTASSLFGDVPPATVHVVRCNAPLVAPKPLPYHSPTFLQFELLPDIEEDLSHPPYTQRVSKRKRECSEEEDAEQFCPSKRRALHLASHIPPPSVARQTRHVRGAGARQSQLLGPSSQSRCGSGTRAWAPYLVRR